MRWRRVLGNHMTRIRTQTARSQVMIGSRETSEWSVNHGKTWVRVSDRMVVVSERDRVNGLGVPGGNGDSHSAMCVATMSSLRAGPSEILLSLSTERPHRARSCRALVSASLSDLTRSGLRAVMAWSMDLVCSGWRCKCLTHCSIADGVTWLRLAWLSRPPSFSGRVCCSRAWRADCKVRCWSGSGP